MIFRPDVLAQAPSAYDALAEYFRDIRSFYEVISVRFAIPEYGVRLTPVAGNELHSNANSFLLSDNSSYPYYLWLPTWLGRFYIDPERVPAGCPIDDCPTDKAGLVAFVWPWLGFNDAYVKDADGPECWFGVADPRPEDPNETVRTTATSLFNYFRVERTLDDEKDGWATGSFAGREIGCNLTGRWHLRRTPMASLTSYYEVERNIVRPLGEKFTTLATSPTA